MTQKANIAFHFTDKPLTIDQKKITKWLKDSIVSNGQKPGNINIIFCSDKYLLDINKKYLNHNYYTDIITFPFEGNFISGDLYISVDRVADNAKTYKQDFEIELLRVIVHGVLHLLGYKDKTKKEKEEIRNLEDLAIKNYISNYANKQTYYEQVYDVVRCIPYGKVTTYGLIADFLSLGSARMVGYALNNLSSFMIDVPAHRVVNVKGELSGALHFGADQKMAKLLKKEGVPIKDNKVENFNNYIWKPKF